MGACLVVMWSGCQQLLDVSLCALDVASEHVQMCSVSQHELRHIVAGYDFGSLQTHPLTLSSNNLDRLRLRLITHSMRHLVHRPERAWRNLAEIAAVHTVVPLTGVGRASHPCFSIFLLELCWHLMPGFQLRQHACTACG